MSSVSPLVSIVTVVYNGEKYLEHTILSVLNQTYKNIEYIIIDGGSTDGTLDIIRKYENRINYWISEKDDGIYDAMNKGIDSATGEWINFMNAGDIFADKNVLYDVFYNNPMTNESLLIYGNALLTPAQTIQDQFDWHKDWCKKIIHQSIFINSEFFIDNRFVLEYKIMADYNLIRQCIYNYPTQITHIKRTICHYDTNGVSGAGIQKYFNEHLKIASVYGVKVYLKVFIHVLPRVVFSIIKGIVKK